MLPWPSAAARRATARARPQLDGRRHPLAPLRRRATPTTAHSAMAGCVRSTSSISSADTLKPPVLMMSTLVRPSSRYEPSSTHGHVAGAEPAVAERRAPSRRGAASTRGTPPARAPRARPARPSRTSTPCSSTRRTSTPGSGAPTQPGPPLAVQRVRQRHADLGHAVALEQRVAADLAPALEHLHRQRRRARHHQPQARARPPTARRCTSAGAASHAAMSRL